MARVDSGPLQLLVKKFTYDFAVNGGAISAITLGTLPDNAVMTDSYLDVHTAATSDGSATILLKVGATEVKAATAYDATPYTGAVLKKVLDAKTSAETAVTVTIATAVLTAGAFNFWVQYYQGA